MRRRDFLTSVATAGVAAAAGAQTPASVPPKRRVRQALMRFNFGAGSTLTFDDMCREAARLGGRSHGP